jgi:hypothetical protein
MMLYKINHEFRFYFRMLLFLFHLYGDFALNVTKVEEITHFPEMVKHNQCLIVPTLIRVAVTVTLLIPE